jgi:3-hydroxyisobutyrate dehydrogenase-like beta-hydroxyacid dehydrogenase
MAAAQMADRIGLAGLGIMGSRMAANVAAAGLPLTVWNRTAETARTWAEKHGAGVAETPAQLAQASDIVVTMVVDADSVRAVLFGPEGVVAGAHPGLLCVDMSTIGPAAAVAIGADLAAAGIGFVDAPVTGSAPAAQDGTLTIMAGGDREAFERARPLFAAVGELVVHAGAVGQGQAVKVINNAVAAANAAAVAEALVVASAEGVDLDALIAVMEAGSGASKMLTLKATPMREHDFTPLFKLEHMLKDVRLALDAAESAGVGHALAAARHAAELLATAAAEGYAERDFAALLAAVETAASHPLKG